MEDRLKIIETKMAHLDFSVEKIASELEAQKKAFYDLEKSLRRLQTRLEKSPAEKNTPEEA